MHSPAPLPYVDLTDAQWHLLGELVSAGMTDPSGSAAAAATAAARDVDPHVFPSEVAVLTWLKLAERSGDQWTVTDLGAALHYRRQCESLELRLSEVARLAAADEASGTPFASAVRRLAQGSLPFATAMEDLRRTA